MKKITLIGSGFSAAITKILLKDRQLDVISCHDPSFLRKKYFRRKSIECNKLFSKKTFSYGSINYKTKKIKIHDRLALGGNSSIWGGMINTSNLTVEFIKILEENKVFLENLNFKKKGYASNNKNIKQICDSKGKIFNAEKYFLNYENSFLDSFTVEKNRIKLKVIKPNEKTEIKYTEKLILAVSFPQLIDLLTRSELINKNVNLTLDEYRHKFQLSFEKKLEKYNFNKTIAVKFSFFKVIDHYFGIKLFKFMNFLKIPVYINQLFFFNKKRMKLYLDLKSKIITNDSNEFLGNSIHYCNLFIDDENINDYLKKISKNILGVSMPFAVQENPGPISSDIINHILKQNFNN